MSLSYSINIKDHETKLLFSGPLNSEDDIKAKQDLFKTDLNNKLSFYFPKTFEAIKIQNYVNRIFSTIIAFFLDLVSLPFNYQNLRNNLKNSINIYKFLKDENVPEKDLKNAKAFYMEYLSKTVDRKGLCSYEEILHEIDIHPDIGFNNKTLTFSDRGISGATNVKYFTS